MDSITRTANAAMVSYYNVLRRMGGIKRQDKYRLLVLWFYNYLKNRSDYLWDIVYNAESDKWEVSVNRKREMDLERRYRKNLQCLAQSSCLIKIHHDDRCIPVSDIIWGATDDSLLTYNFLVTNATEITDEMLKDINVNDDIEKILGEISEQLPEGGAFIKDNADEHYMTSDN